MNQFTITKNTNGWNLAVKQSRLSFLKAFFLGKMTLNLDKETASTISNILYTPKVKKNNEKFIELYERLEEISNRDIEYKASLSAISDDWNSEIDSHWDSY